MSDLLYVVRYTGPFGFIKPWTAVRDSTTYSQQFLTPSILEGMRRKLGTGPILRSRLSYIGLSLQKEEVQPRGVGKAQKKPVRKRAMLGEPSMYVEGGVLDRYVLLQPHLYLAFASEDDANNAATQHLCLCRNEDVVLPDGLPHPVPVNAFEAIPGFEFRPTAGPGAGAMLVGYDRYADEEGCEAAMWGHLNVTGDAVRPVDAEDPFTLILT